MSEDAQRKMYSSLQPKILATEQSRALTQSYQALDVDSALFRWGEANDVGKDLGSCACLSSMPHTPST